jgi:hypothetical protein
MKKVVGFLVGVFIICLIVFAVHKGKKPLPQNEISETVNINVSIPAESPISWTTPGVPPGSIKLNGSMIDEQCQDAFNAKCWVDYSSQVVGGTLNFTFTAQEDKSYTLVYSLSGERRVDKISVNGKTLTSFGVLGTSPYQWVVACFIPHREQTGALTINPNPNCEAQIVQVRLVYTGDTGGSGIGSYTNGEYNMPFDDPISPFNGKKEGPIHLQTSYWDDPNPNGKKQIWVWEEKMQAYTATFHSVATDQAALISVYHNCRNPLAKQDCHEPGFGLYSDVMPVGGGAIQCTTQLVHYNDIDPSPNYWMAAIITGINNATHCITQGADTRGMVISGP